VVTSIGNQAFRTRSAVSLTVTLPKAAPAMSYSGLNSSYYYTKTVTIKTPAGKTGYNTTWENNFKSSFYPYSVSDITLNYAVLP
jgi:hypothetical protein